MRPAQSTILNFSSSVAEVDNSAGEDMTWDNSNIFGSPEGSYTVVNPLWTPFSKDFSNASWALLSDEITTFYNTADTALVYYGGTEGSNVVYYSDPQVYFSFPFTHGDTWSDEYSGNFWIDGVDYSRTGTISATGNGWGSIILPGGIYDNVLRCEMVETLSDESIVISYTLEFSYTAFYSTDLGFWVLQYGEIVYTDDQGGNQTFPYTQYIDSVDLNVEEPSVDETDLIVYPNPTADFISLNSTKLGQVYQIFSLEGKFMASGLVDGLSIDVSGFSPGTYTLNVINKQNVQSAMFVKE